MSSRSRALVGLAAVLTVVYFIAPASGAAEAIRVLSPAIAVGAIVVGIAGFRPTRQAAMGADRTVDGVARRSERGVGECSSSGATTRSRRPATRSISCRPWRSLSVCRSSRVTRGPATGSAGSRWRSSGSPSRSVSGSPSSSRISRTATSLSVTGSGRCSCRCSEQWPSRWLLGWRSSRSSVRQHRR